MKESCSKCSNILDENRQNKQRYCLSCHNEYMRQTRKKHSELSHIQKLKANARSYLNVYIKRGKIKKESCKVCGTIENVQAHHNDYNKPLEVIWLCVDHHIELHKNINNDIVD